MELCSNGHDEVCYDCKECPVCEMEASKDKRINELEKEVSNLENDIYELQKQLPA